MDVLILVVVDDGLVLGETISLTGEVGVLILVVVDDGLVHHYLYSSWCIVLCVLILVVVDDGLVLWYNLLIGATLSMS